MADSSEKVSFRVDMQCSSLRAKAFLVFDRGSQPTCCQQSADSRPTNGQQSADCWEKIFVKGGKRQLANSRPTVGRLLVGGAVLHFSPQFGARKIESGVIGLMAPKPI